MRRRSRARREAPKEGHERWLITYADLITLLMIFFVVMYSMSQVDAAKYTTLSQTLKTTFSSGDGNLPAGSGILDGAHTSPGTSGTEDTNKQEDGSGEGGALADTDTDANDIVEEQPSDVMIGEITEKDLAFRKQEEQLEQVMSTIQQYITDNKLQNNITVTDIPKGIEIRLSDSLLFALGKSDLNDAATPTLKKLASLFKQMNSTISIEGHTDNLAMAPGARFKDNWELSAERALSVLRYFVDEQKLDSSNFQIAGYGDTRPVSENETDTGRKKNRRVEIIILRSVLMPE